MHDIYVQNSKYFTNYKEVEIIDVPIKSGFVPSCGGPIDDIGRYRFKSPQSMLYLASRADRDRDSLEECMLYYSDNERVGLVVYRDDTRPVCFYHYDRRTRKASISYEIPVVTDEEVAAFRKENNINWKCLLAICEGKLVVYIMTPGLIKKKTIMNGKKEMNYQIID